MCKNNVQGQHSGAKITKQYQQNKWQRKKSQGENNFRVLCKVRGKCRSIVLLQ